MRPVVLVGADAERSCSRRRSVTDAACPLRVLIGPLARFEIHLYTRRGGRLCPFKGPLTKRGLSALRADFEPILFFLFQKEKNGFNLPRKERGLCKTGSANRTAIASEEASSIPFPPGRRKLHIRSLLLPSQIVTVSLGHNLAIWNFTTPHAILMMAGT